MDPRRQKITCKRGRKSSRTFNCAFRLFTWNGDTLPGEGIQLQCRDSVKLNYTVTHTQHGQFGNHQQIAQIWGIWELAVGQLWPQAPCCASSTPGQAQLHGKKQNLKIELFFLEKRVLLHLHKNCCQKENIFMCSGRPDVTRGCLMDCRVRISRVLQTVGFC